MRLSMDSQEFVAALHVAARDTTASSVMSALERPPGKRPAEDMLARSRYYHSLDEEQKRILSSIVLYAVDLTVFGFLCIIDGVKVFEDIGEKGELELWYVGPGNERVLLNPPEGDFLHDLW
jgi:hypothetical protein